MLRKSIIGGHSRQYPALLATNYLLLNKRDDFIEFEQVISTA